MIHVFLLYVFITTGENKQLVEKIEDVLFAADIIIEAAHTDFCSFGDIAYGRFVIAFFFENQKRSPYNLAALVVNMLAALDFCGNLDG